MKTKRELTELSNAIGKAISTYHNAIFENLKEGGKEYNVNDDDDDETNGIRLNIDGRHDDLVNIVVDKIRYNKERGIVEIHVSEEEYENCDVWYAIYILGDDEDYVNDCIVWDS